MPKEVTDKGVISIAYVVHGYRYIRLPENVDAGYGQSVGCHINVNCSEGQNWQQEKNAIALILVNGNRYCTGSLVNTTANDFSPLFLTADHCLGGWANDYVKYDALGNSNLSHWSFYWHYETPGCTNTSDPPYVPTTGATVVANNAASDFALLRLTENPRNKAGVTPYYLGWDCSGNAGTSGVGIHHPNGDVKKISATNQIQNHSGQLLWTGGESSPANSHWDATFYNGLTEGGSSGSPLINSAGRIIGQLHGGPAATCNTNYVKRYGKFSVSWAGVNATETNIHRKLQPWINPANNVTTLDGVSPYSISGPPTISYSSGAIFTVSNPPSGYIWTCSSNLTAGAASGNSKTFTANSTNPCNAWVAVKVGSIEIARKNITILPSYPDLLNVTINSGCEGAGVYYAYVYDMPAGLNQSTTYFDWMTHGGWTIIQHPQTQYDSPPMRGVRITAPHPQQSTVLGIRACNPCGCTEWESAASLSPCSYYSIQASPNPVGATLTVRIAVDEAAYAQRRQGGSSVQSGKAIGSAPVFDLKLFNSYGLPMRQTASSAGVVSIDVSGLPNGIYFLHVYDDDSTTTPIVEKIIVNH